MDSELALSWRGVVLEPILARGAPSGSFWGVARVLCHAVEKVRLHLVDSFVNALGFKKKNHFMLIGKG